MPIVYITCCAARRHNLARFFLSVAQFLTVNSGGRFFNRTPSVLLSSTSERPSTAKTTQHPDPSIDPQVDPSHPSPHPSFPFVPATSCPDPNIDPQVDQAYFAPHPPRLPHGFNYDISKTSLLYSLCLICFWHLRTLSKNRTNERNVRLIINHFVMYHSNLQVNYMVTVVIR